MRSLIAVVLGFALLVGVADADQTRNRPANKERVVTMHFAASGATIDTLDTGGAATSGTSDVTRAFNVAGAAEAFLQMSVDSIAASDGADTVIVQVAGSVDGTNFSGYTSIDSLIFSASGGQFGVTDLLHSSVSGSLGWDVNAARRIKLRFISGVEAEEDFVLAGELFIVDPLK